ncbi:hypothetical protein C6380_28960 [Pseudomonas syringae pv. actinidiae]|nr:hypothetical protein D9N00_17030 [Pseudomonas syringae pv. actinidiae]AYL80838.1 hypothetical protein CN228_13490 [Pseudomonas syringae pv. actinidiae str. Shaanxi_M228]RJX46932.1 hypothetical protein C6380_28960 [Pseudomonas syringae pv. actinidiae]RJX51002.1 hypothetical protein C6379_22055 [Pseudomonas syringae pv. actinidiae]RJX58416.1 hypothetical protein C6383_17375 [Pseudomonas syringae pv. actinidiae]
MFAKKASQSTYFWRLHWRFREQVRSHGLRPESKTDLCITMSTARGNTFRDAPRHTAVFLCQLD